MKQIEEEKKDLEEDVNDAVDEDGFVLHDDDYHKKTYFRWTKNVDLAILKHLQENGKTKGVTDQIVALIPTQYVK